MKKRLKKQLFILSLVLILILIVGIIKVFSTKENKSEKTNPETNQTIEEIQAKIVKEPLPTNVPGLRFLRTWIDRLRGVPSQ